MRDPILIRPGYNGRAIWWIPGYPKPDLEKIDRREAVSAEINSKKSERGGWTRAQLAQWGVPWPPPHGWLTELLEYGFPYRGRPVKPTWRSKKSYRREYHQNSYANKIEKELGQQCELAIERDNHTGSNWEPVSRKP